MYKVFVNEKKLSLCKTPEKTDKNLRFEGNATFAIALDQLENTSTPEIAVYSENMEEMWQQFSDSFRIIEAAGGVVVNGEGKILFIKRLGKWDLPKGKIEKNESREHAAVREVGEETGLDTVKIGDFLNTTYHIYTEKNGEKILKTTHWFIMEYSGNDTPKPQLEEGITEVSWKNKAEIERDVLEKTFKNIRLILDEYFQRP